MTHRSLVRGAAFAAALCLSSAAMAQAGKPKKPKTPATKPAEQPPEEPKPEAAETAAPAAAPEEKEEKTPPPPPPPEEWDDTDVTEKPGKKYYFVGLRYRGTIVPKFILNMFVDEGATFFSNTFGAELDIRKDDFSLIPALTYVEYGTDDILFKEKGKTDASNNWSVVNSNLKALYLTANLLWSTKVHKNWDLEYGAGFGIGMLFGSLENNWVYNDPNGALERENGVRYSKCQNERQQDIAPFPAGVIPVTGTPTCARPSHSNANVAKVDGYKEEFWTGGGSVPNVFIHLAIPQLGVRFKPRKDMQARFGFGFSLTGFWFGLSANYGLENVLDKPKTEPGGGKDPKLGARGLPQLVTNGPQLMPLAF